MLIPLCPLSLDLGLHLLGLFKLMQSIGLVICCLLTNSFQTSRFRLFTEIQLSASSCFLLLDCQSMSMYGSFMMTCLLGSSLSELYSLDRRSSGLDTERLGCDG
jgi:hypothetical protein